MAHFVRIFQQAFARFGSAGGTPPEPPPPHGILAKGTVFIVASGGVFITSME
jgi:hypothetical protein